MGHPCLILSVQGTGVGTVGRRVDGALARESLTQSTERSVSHSPSSLDPQGPLLDFLPYIFLYDNSLIFATIETLHHFYILTSFSTN